MQTVSILVRVQSPNPMLFERMLASVLAQTSHDWELVLVVSNHSPGDFAIAQRLAEGQPTVRVEVRPEGELLAWSCNALLDTLGDWVAFLGQHDQLIPGALEAMATAIANNPGARVIYSDQEALGTWGQISLQTAKGPPDPIRLKSEEYLQDLALIQKSLLITAGGFDRLASDCPTHDIYLRLLEAEGISGFAYTPARLYRRHRNRMTERSDDPRISPYLPRYDLDAVRRHFERLGIFARIKQLNGTLDIRIPVEVPPSLTFIDTAGKTPEALNQEASLADTQLILFLRGEPISKDWLKHLIGASLLPGVTAVGGMTITPTHLADPGALLDGSPWNIRGNFNQITVLHSVSMLSPTCLLVDTRKFLEVGGFDPEFPTLYGMDLTLRLSRGGHGCVRSPLVQIKVKPNAAPEPEELAKLRAAWGGWEDPYGLHQLP
ncbi:glycosyltransferase [Dyella sp. ASV21]|uniref:glycosyltransferase family 2 protein n=1 Tax=Dyella sp. ASV21 TaxID=2795114 RepID=UPI0018EA91D3|nr:glycosyltransferase [Dyella sp. ASV21]